MTGGGITGGAAGVPPTGTPPTRVLLADDQELVRAGLRMMVDSAPDLTVVGEAATGRQAIRLAKQERADVVLMDIRMPELDGLAATRQITADESLAGVVAQAATALDNARLIETLAHQARHDSLTGLLGHRAFHEALETDLRGAAEGHAFTLALLDIDDFKVVNDLHGHPVGDEALRKVAEALRRCIRDHDTIFRVGGEEFAVLLPHLASKDALPVAERLRAAVGRIPFPVPLHVSIGLASSPDDAMDRDGLLERADAALYAAKGAGKDRTSLAAVGA